MVVVVVWVGALAAACVALCFWSAYLCVDQRVWPSAEIFLPPSDDRICPNAILFPLPLSGECLFSLLSRFDSRATLEPCFLPGKRMGGWGGCWNFSAVLTRCPSRQVCRFAGMRRFHPRWKLEICASSGGSRARLGGKTGSDTNARAGAACHRRVGGAVF